MIGDPTNELPTEVTCCDCGGETKLKWEDQGIGPYELNGYRNHVDFQEVTVCCGFEDWEYLTGDEQ